MIPSLKQPYRFIIDVIIFAALLPIAWPLADREPPWTRLWGEITPTHAGDFFQIHWHTTPLRRECPGTIQVEINSGFLVWPTLKRQVNSELVEGQIDYITPPWPLPLTVPVGKATYRVTTFWFCNWIQEFLNWPVIQVGPDVDFDVLPAVRPGQGRVGPAGPMGATGPVGPQGPKGDEGK